jgi:hypothetical protein
MLREALGGRRTPEEYAPSCIPAERADVAECVKKEREGNRNNEVESPCNGRREGHAQFTNVQRKRLRGVGEWHRSLTGGVAYHIEVDSKCNNSNTRSRCLTRYEETKASHKQEERHKREGNQE